MHVYKFLSHAFGPAVEPICVFHENYLQLNPLLHYNNILHSEAFSCKL